jgi:hypothetical protein
MQENVAACQLMNVVGKGGSSLLVSTCRSVRLAASGGRLGIAVYACGKQRASRPQSCNYINIV